MRNSLPGDSDKSAFSHSQGQNAKWMATCVMSALHANSDMPDVDGGFWQAIKDGRRWPSSAFPACRSNQISCAFHCGTLVVGLFPPHSPSAALVGGQSTDDFTLLLALSATTQIQAKLASWRDGQQGQKLLAGAARFNDETALPNCLLSRRAETNQSIRLSAT